jgi:hypothetical protein
LHDQRKFAHRVPSYLLIQAALGTASVTKPLPSVAFGYVWSQLSTIAEEINVGATIGATLLGQLCLPRCLVYPRKELGARLDRVRAELARNPVITGDAEATATKLLAEMRRRVDAAPARCSELLKIRKEFNQ